MPIYCAITKNISESTCGKFNNARILMFGPGSGGGRGGGEGGGG